MAPIFKNWDILRVWDKILLCTLLRAYKQMTIPGPHKLETIYQAQSILQ